MLRHPLRGTVVLLVLGLVLHQPLFAINPNDAPGFPTNATMLEGPGGDSISAFSGNLELSVPIGSTWDLPGMSWGLNLHYTSKIWRLWENQSQAMDGTLTRRGPFGVGWRLTMGRVFVSCREACTGFEPVYFEDSAGTVHPIKLDTAGWWSGQNPVRGQTTDATYMRVEAWLKDANLPISRGNLDFFKVFPGNGLVLIFGRQLSDADAHWSETAGASDDYDGWHLTRMQKQGPIADPNAPYSWVNVTYETTPGLEHCIEKIEDGHVGRTGTLRTISFTNAATLGGVTVEGGYTTAITIPAVRGQASATATYTFDYALQTMSLGEGTDPNSPYYLQASHANQLTLTRVNLPKESSWAGNYSYTFAYDPGTGELTRQALPTGGTLDYAYQSYPFKVADIRHFGREVERQCLPTCNPGPNQTAYFWDYYRWRGSLTGTVTQFALVTDPFGNQTKYLFYGPDPNDPIWSPGLTKAVGIYAGAPFGLYGTVVARGSTVQTISYKYQNFGTPGVDDIRLTETTTLWGEGGSSRSSVVHSGALPYGRFTKTEEYGFNSASVPERTIEREYDPDPDPNASPARWSNWVTQALRSETLKDRDGAVVRRSEWTYLDDGRPATSAQVADPSGADPDVDPNDDLVTTYEYDGFTGLPFATTLWTRGQDPNVNPYATRFYFQGPYLVRKRTLDKKVNPSGVEFPYATFDVTRDDRTGAIISSRDPSGIETGFEYDILGRPTRIIPPLPEMPTEINYVDLRQTKTWRGTGPGQIESWSYLDEFGRPVESRRLTGPGTYSAQTTCYDVAGRPTFVSEWHTPPSNSTPGTPVCPPASGAPEGTSFDYIAWVHSFVEMDPNGSDTGAFPATDPLGRVHKVTAADGSRTATDYQALDTTVTSFNINGSPSANTGLSAVTGFQRDAYGRLTYVDAPAGADGRYSYDAAGDLTRVELINAPLYTPPFIQVRSFTYDPLGRLRSSTNSESGTVLYEKYDAAGNVVEKLESDATEFTMEYDAAGRLLTVRSAHADPNGVYGPPVLLARYTYDDPLVPNGRGRLTQVESFDESGALIVRKRLSYDGLGGRLGSEATLFALWDGRDGETAGDPEFRTCYGYDGFGLLASLRYPAALACGTPSVDVATLQYRYAYGQLNGVNDSRRNPSPDPANSSTWKLIKDALYNPAGGLQVLDYANGVTTTITPDVMMRPSRILVQGPGGGPTSKFLDDGVYSYDGVGNITAIGDDAFSYDRIGRLVSATMSYNNQTYQRSWTYDDFGNILQENRTDPGAGPTAKVFQVDPFTNRIVNMGNPSAPFIYDQRGNLNREEAQRYLFDDRNRLLTVKKDENLQPAGVYAYDAAGLRVLKDDPATGRGIFYVRDGGGNVLSEFIPSGAGLSEGFWQKDYFYALGKVIGQAEEKVPKPVEGLKSSWSTVGGTTTVTLSWEALSEGAVTGYRVHRKGPGATEWSDVVTLTPSTDPNWSEVLPGSGAYFYRVAALNAGGEGVTSRSVRIEPGASLTDPDPNAVALTATSTPFSVILRWNRVPEDVDGLAAEPATTFLGYNIYRRDISTDPNAPSISLTLVPLRGTVFRDLGVEEGRTYLYEVRPLGASGHEAASVTASAQPRDGTPPAMPQNPRAWSGPKAGEVTLTWAPNTEDDLAGYRVWRKVDGTGQWEPVATASPLSTQATVSNLTEKTTYTFALAAYDAAGNESRHTKDLVARPRVSYPSRPWVGGEAWLGWLGGSGAVWYGGPPGDASAYSAFRVYKKEEGLPQDRWELVFTDPVTHTESGDVFAGRFVDPWANRCRVTEYVVAGVDADGDETEDTPVTEVRYFLAPRPPAVSVAGNKLRFDVEGFVNCSTIGNGFQVIQWKLEGWGPGPTDADAYLIDPNVGYVEVDKPPHGEVWSFFLTGRVMNLYQSAMTSTQVIIDTYLSEDICVDSDGQVISDDTACKDKDGSQPHPPPPEPRPPDCGGPNGGNCAGGPESRNDAWQWTTATSNTAKGVRLRDEYLYSRLRQPPAEEGPVVPFPGLREEAAPGEVGWVVARARRPGIFPDLVAAATRPASSDTVGVDLGAVPAAAPHTAAQDLGATRVILDEAQTEQDGSGGAADRVAFSGAGQAISAHDASASASSDPRDVRGVATPDDRTLHVASTTLLSLPDLQEIAAPWVSHDAAASPNPLTTSFDSSRQALGSFTPPGAAALLAGGLNVGHFLITGSSPKSFAWQFFSWDHLGSVRVVTSETGTKLWETKYLPYGEEIPDPSRSESGNTHRFTGHERDSEDDIDYMFARHYRLATSRFLSSDFVPGRASRPESHNLYAYVDGNPSNLVDPYGLSPFRGPVQDMIDTGGGRTIGWDGRPAGGTGSIIGNCGPLCGGAGSSSATGSAGDDDGPKDLDFELADPNSDQPKDFRFMEWVTVIGEGAVVALEWTNIRSLNVPGPYGSERAAHRHHDSILWSILPNQSWNDPGENLKGPWDWAYKASYLGSAAFIGAAIVADLSGVGGWSMRIHLDPPTHYFKELQRKAWHIQINVWEKGVKGSGREPWRYPLW